MSLNSKKNSKIFSVALLTIVLAVLLTLFIPSLSDGGMYFLFLTAIIFSTLHGDVRSGSFATVISIFANLLILFYLGKFPQTFGEWLVIIAFGLASAFTVYICYAQMEAEIARRLAESKYRMIFENAITGIYETTVDGKYVTANPTLAIMFGYETSADLIKEAENLNDRFYVIEGRRKEFIRQISENGQILEFESEIYSPDGSKIWISENAVAVIDENNRLIGFQGTTIDITDRKNAELELQKAHDELEDKVIQRTGELEQANKVLREEIAERRRISVALRESEEKFKTLVETGTDWVWETDAKGFYIYASPQIKDFIGYEPEEIIGKRPYDIMPPVEAERVKQVVRKLTLEKKGHTLFESLAVHKNGSLVTTETSNILIYDEQGNLRGARGIARNITERKRAETTLREIERQLRSIVTAAPIILCAIDSNGIFTLSEGKGLDLLNLRPGEAVGQSIFELYQDFPKVIDDVRRSLSGETFASVLTVGDLTFETRFLPIINEQGKVVEVIGVAVDTTGQKRIENELLASQNQLRDLSAHLESVREEERKYIARELHDELGQTLTALKIDLTKLDERIPNLQNEAVRRQIISRVPVMIDIVDAAMETTRKIVSQLRPAVLDELGLADAVEWQVLEFQKLTSIKCELDINFNDKDLSQNLKTAMFRILQECLTNITRHAAATKVKIALENDSETIFFSIEDNGRGIGKPKMATTKSFGISGMRERALLLGGTLDITRPENGGTQVTVRIPCLMNKPVNSNEKPY